MGTVLLHTPEVRVQSCPWPSCCCGEAAAAEKTGLGTGARGPQLVSRGPLAPAPASPPVRAERHDIAREDRSPTLWYSPQTRA